MSDIEARLKSLKRDQLVSLLAGAKKVLSLNTANKSKAAMVKMAMALHGSSSSPNKFEGKMLFGDSKENAHIVLPARESKAETKIKKGEILNDQNIIFKRPQLQNNAELYFKVLGKKSKKDFKKDQIIKF